MSSFAFEQQADQVTSYVVNADGALTGVGPLRDALAKGWRVVDVVVTPTAGVGNAVACVTVVLTAKGTGGGLPYKSWLKDGLPQQAPK